MYTTRKHTAIPHSFVLGLFALVALGPYGCVVEEAEQQEDSPPWIVTDDERDDRSSSDEHDEPYRDTGVEGSTPYADTGENRDDRDERDTGAPTIADAGHQGSSPVADATDDPGPPRKDTGGSIRDAGVSTHDTAETVVADTSTEDARADTSDASDCLFPVLCHDLEREADTTSSSDAGSETAGTCDGGACNDATPRGIDLSGRWLAEGYGCRADHFEVIDIEHTRHELVATKRVGDPCVRSGMETFRTSNPGALKSYQEISVRARAGAMHGSSTSWHTTSLEVVSEDHLEFSNGNIELRRADTTNLGTANLSGDWEAESYRCRGNYLKSSMTLRHSFGQLIGETTRGRNCLVEWNGKRSDNKFSVDITVVDANGNHKTIPGTATILARSFILVEPTHRFWNIRMREKSFF